MNPATGILFVISGPSGVGKGTVIKEVFKQDKNLVFSVSVTTRQPRSGECDGCDYRFVSEDQFLEMAQENKFLEWVHVHGNHYGTPVDFVEEKLAEGRDMVLDIDVQGAMKIMKSRPESTFIFIAPPNKDIEVLRKRLCGRNTEKQCQIEERLRVAAEEMKQLDKYEYLVFNSEVPEAADDILSIIKAERCKTNRFTMKNQKPNTTKSEISR